MSGLNALASLISSVSGSFSSFVLLMPTSTAGYRAMHTIYAEREGARVNAELEGKAARVILACDGTVSLDL